VDVAKVQADFSPLGFHVSGHNAPFPDSQFSASSCEGPLLTCSPSSGS
jgi:hypothetical protein